MKMVPPAPANRPNLEIYADAEALAHCCLELFCDCAAEAIQARGYFYTAIPGGKTPRRFFELLGGTTEGRLPAWDKIHLFWSDERCVPPDSAESNYRVAAEAFLNKVPIPEKNVHRVLTELGDWPLAARRYEQSIRDAFGPPTGQSPHFDLIILGMGSDGHIASLFRGSCAVLDKKNLVAAVNSPNVSPADRITFTPALLTAASAILVLITGMEKAQIVRRVFTGPPNEIDYPVHVLFSVLHKTIFLLDAPAAELIHST